MAPVIRYAKIDVAVNIAAIQQEVLSLANGWIPHFNTMHYEGNWTVLPLRSPGGSAEQIIPDILHKEPYMNTPLMQACAAIQNLLAAWQCPLKSVRLLNLHSGSVIKEHCDHELSFEQGEARLHFPVFTNSGVEFYVEGHLLPM